MVSVEMLLEGKETTPAAPRRSFPPPIFSSRSLFRGFCVSAALSFAKALGGLYIVVFRSRRSFGKKDRRQRRPEGQDGGPHAVRESGHVGPPLLAFWSPFLRFLCAYVSFLPKKMIPVKFQVIWTSFGSLKHQNIEKGVF
jgi:hypothetical protein